MLHPLFVCQSALLPTELPLIKVKSAEVFIP